jgi:hypothetical protein
VFFVSLSERAEFCVAFGFLASRLLLFLPSMVLFILILVEKWYCLSYYSLRISFHMSSSIFFSFPTLYSSFFFFSFYTYLFLTYLKLYLFYSSLF